MIFGTGASSSSFQHTAARRRLLCHLHSLVLHHVVSTHSRAEAAAFSVTAPKLFASIVSTHSRAEAAALLQIAQRIFYGVSTHSRAEAAASHACDFSQ